MKKKIFGIFQSVRKGSLLGKLKALASKSRPLKYGLGASASIALLLVFYTNTGNISNCAWYRDPKTGEIRADCNEIVIAPGKPPQIIDIGQGSGGSCWSCGDKPDNEADSSCAEVRRMIRNDPGYLQAKVDEAVALARNALEAWPKCRGFVGGPSGLDPIASLDIARIQIVKPSDADPSGGNPCKRNFDQQNYAPFIYASVGNDAINIYPPFFSDQKIGLKNRGTGSLGVARATTILHEISHRGGIDHPTDWDRRILQEDLMYNCFPGCMGVNSTYCP